MYYKLFFRGTALLIALTVVFSCTTMLSEETIISSGAEKIQEDWKLSNTRIINDEVVLSETGASVTSNFSARNFDLSMRLMTTPGAEGSLAFHTTGAGGFPESGYRVFINNSEYRSGNIEKTGSLSLIRNFYARTAEDNEWFDLGVSVRGNHVIVTVNDRIVSEYYEPENRVRLDWLEGMALSAGKIVVEKSGGQGEIRIAEVSIEGLGNDIERQPYDFETTDEVARQLTLLNQEGFPLIDYHGHLKGIISFDEMAKYGRDHGFNYGVSENCGLNFPVTDDESLVAFYEEAIDEPVFNAMQCEGREWITLFSPGNIALYDYIFTDALTFTDHRGRRMRLWIADEVYVDEEQQFMDMLVDRILSILSQEPVDIYVNPTFLPEVINHRYDELWTPERMNTVIEALVEYDVALEINARYRIPGMEFARRAKEAGVKFTLGTNNAGRHDLGRLEYCIEVIREIGLTPEDMFFPKPEGEKKVLFMGLPAEITG
jgi:hypothetical protein